MITKFWDKLAQGVAGQWAAQKWGPALIFWVIGALSWMFAHSWSELVALLKTIKDPPLYIALAMAGLVLAGVSATIGNWCERPVIRICEGYWYPFLNLIRDAGIKSVRKKCGKLNRKWGELAEEKENDPDNFTPEKETELIRLDVELRQYPVNPHLIMPTTLGNRLRAAEEYPMVRYGLEPVTTWPGLWLVLPEDTRANITATRSELNAGAGLVFWSIATLVWTILCPRVAFLSLTGLLVGYTRMNVAARAYGEMIRSAYDLHRFKLYEALRLSPPASTAAEPAAGERLSEYLLRGTTKTNQRFTHGGN